MYYAIGIVTIVALTPTIVIQIMGLLYQMRINKASALAAQHEDLAIDWGAITVLTVE